MSVAEQTPVGSISKKRPPRRNGRWSGYLHLLMARMLELKREPEVVFWVFVFPLLLAVGLGVAFRNKPGEASSVAIVQGVEAQQAQSLLTRSPQHASFKISIQDEQTSRKGFRLGKYDLVIESDEMEAYNTSTIPLGRRAFWRVKKLTMRCNPLPVVRMLSPPALSPPPTRVLVI